MAKRVLIGMSGGIDSTVAAILLLEQGYELVGATFRTFDPSPSAHCQSPNCASEQSILDAQHMAATLGFEHHILDFRDTFREHVIANFVSEYAHGRTPNPCVLCNSHIKWGKLMQAAEQYGCDYIATGHYAQIAEHRGHTYLKNAVDTHKDQTYFLACLNQRQLAHILFPLGELTKTQVTNATSDLINDAIAQQIASGKIAYDRIGYFEKFSAVLYNTDLYALAPEEKEKALQNEELFIFQHELHGIFCEFPEGLQRSLDAYLNPAAVLRDDRLRSSKHRCCRSTARGIL